MKDNEIIEMIKFGVVMYASIALLIMLVSACSDAGPPASCKDAKDVKILNDRGDIYARYDGYNSKVGNGELWLCDGIVVEK